VPHTDPAPLPGGSQTPRRNQQKENTCPSLVAPKVAPEDSQADAEDSYIWIFGVGGFARSLTYGYGHPTRSNNGAVILRPLAIEDLHRHAARFGPECVKETARVYGGELRNLAVVPKSAAKRQRRTTESLRMEILALRDRGVVPAAIADTLNLSDRRVAEILKAA
jgi:hypothetical protein